jgi:hypothetical protein
MRKAEFTFSPIVYAVLALIILVVCIGIFFVLTKGPLASVFGIVDETDKQSEDSIGMLSILFNRCETGDDGCYNGKSYICENERWKKTEDDC